MTRRLALAYDWRDILRRAWSVRLFALSLACDIAGIWLAVRGAFAHQEGAALALQIAGALFGAAGFAARFIYQRGISKECST